MLCMYILQYRGTKWWVLLYVINEICKIVLNIQKGSFFFINNMPKGERNILRWKKIVIIEL